MVKGQTSTTFESVAMLGPNEHCFLEVQGLYTAGEATRGASRGQNLWKGWLREASRQDCGFAEWLRRASRMFVPQTSLTFAPPMLLNQAESMRKGVMKGGKRGIELQD